ncbi:sugar ABC transporter permease [Grimontia kaedaensis]|uniref:Sugar ABC transporter permease n=2 Tax=Grimontia kaedaensis TaxID=2872157 RepID=A0ABY4X185_9GAMM|nr:sugar ABC transporter permease [Grimontia kaedaensis]USH04977.1 sugar ABC transporter permease [Grimontia kaedaensis]
MTVHSSSASKPFAVQRSQLAMAPWFFLAPAIVVFAIYVLYPIGQSIWLSFFDWDGLGEKTWVGWENYTELFDSDAFYTSLVNNFLWMILFMLAPPIGLLIALFLNQQVAGIRLIKALFFFPFVISQVVVGLVFAWFYDPSFGLLTQFIVALGFDPISILADEDLVTYGIIAAGLWPQVAYCMILYLTGLNNLDPEQLEAARLDGAKGWRMMWYVVVPQLKPATFIAVVVTVIGALRSFDLVATMTAGGPWGSSTVLAYLMYEESIFNYRMGYGAAVAVVLFLIMDIYIAWFLWRMLKGER